MAADQTAESGRKGFALVLAFLSASLLDQSVKLWVEERAARFGSEGDGSSLVLLRYVENSSAFFGWSRRSATIASSRWVSTIGCVLILEANCFSASRYSPSMK